MRERRPWKRRDARGRVVFSRSELIRYTHFSDLVREMRREERRRNRDLKDGGGAIEEVALVSLEGRRKEEAWIGRRDRAELCWRH